MKTRSLVIVGLAVYLWNRYARGRPAKTSRARLPRRSEWREQELDQEQELDDELDGTFPASDPLSITRPPTVTRWKIRR